MFGKLQASQQMNTSGIGLGLFICRRICETFYGDIHLENSELNKGSTFQFKMLTLGEPDQSVINTVT